MSEEGDWSIEIPEDSRANYSLKVTGKVQGPIEGDIEGKGSWKSAKGEIEIWAWGAKITSPRDKASGMLTGKRSHHAVEFLGKLDKAAPKLFTAITTNETLSSVKLTCWSLAKAGAAEQGTTAVAYYTVEMKNAALSEFDQLTTPKDGSMYYRFSMTFGEITYTWVKGGIAAMDTWDR